METDFSNPMVFDQKVIKDNGKSNIPQEMNLKKWNTIYTTYFNKTLTVSEGRRLPLDKCVENPNIHLL